MTEHLVRRRRVFDRIFERKISLPGELGPIAESENETLPYRHAEHDGRKLKSALVRGGAPAADVRDAHDLDEGKRQAGKVRHRGRIRRDGAGRIDHGV